VEPSCHARRGPKPCAPSRYVPQDVRVAGAPTGRGALGRFRAVRSGALHDLTDAGFPPDLGAVYEHGAVRLRGRREPTRTVFFDVEVGHMWFG
jgi:hypothetical protein